MSKPMGMGWRLGLLAAAVLWTAGPLHAATAPTTTDMTLDSDAHRASLPASAMPALSSADAWVGAMAIVILAMFAMAAVIGPISRANMPPEIPDAGGHGHDDSHGHDDGHAHDDTHGAAGDLHGHDDGHGH